MIATFALGLVGSDPCYADLLFNDSEMQTSDYEKAFVFHSFVGTGGPFSVNVIAGQDASDGFNQPSYLLRFETDTDDAVGTAHVAGYLVNTVHHLDPSTTPIAAVRMYADYKTTTPMHVDFVMFQYPQNKWYKMGSLVDLDSTNWAGWDSGTWTPDVWGEVDSFLDDSPDYSSNPNFTNTGGPIEFGIHLRLAQELNGKGLYTNEFRIDNFRVDFTPGPASIPEPSTLCLLGIGAIVATYKHRRRTKISRA